MLIFSLIKSSTRTVPKLIVLCFFLAQVGCSFKSATFSDGEYWIPKDFNPSNSVLLIEPNPVNQKQNERMIKWLKSNYPYKFEIADSNTIKGHSGKYADLKKYQFGVHWVIKGIWRTRYNPNGLPTQDREYDLYGNFIDRSTGKSYPTTTRINNYGQVGYKPFFQTITKKFK